MRAQGSPITLPANPAGGDIARFLRVKITGGVIALAGITDREIGTLEDRYKSSGLGKSSVAAVIPMNAEGSRMVVVATAVTQFAPLYTAANGKLSATNASTSIPWGIALQAATADGDEIEALPHGQYAPAI